GTDAIAEGDTRVAGLEQLLNDGCTISRAIRALPWPGTASQQVSIINFTRMEWSGERLLDGNPVSNISCFLDDSKQAESANALAANEPLSFEGAKPAATGFVLTPQEAERLLKADPKNSAVLFPYLRGEELNSRPDQAPCFWVIDFGNRSLAEA